MEKVLTNLKPTKVFEFFEDLCHIPRERLSVESTARIYEFICKLLEESLDRKA